MNSPWTPSFALLLTRAATGFAILLQTLELLQLRQHMGPQGIWRWADLRKEYAKLPRPVLSIFDALLGDRGIIPLLGLRLILALGLLIPLHDTQLDLIFGIPSEMILGGISASLLTITWLIGVRFRGSYNGGSDFMTLVLLTGLSFCYFFKSVEIGIQAGLGYIAFQSCNSYFLAGLIKLRKRNWRTGVALKEFLGMTIYSRTPVLERIRNDTLMLRLASWSVIAFECLFPGVIFFTPAGPYWIALALCFHMANFLIFGLNHFVWAWLASYPAIFFCWKTFFSP